MNAPSTDPLLAERQTLPDAADRARADPRGRGLDGGLDGGITPDPRGRHARV